MTRKDYELIARAIRTAVEQPDRLGTPIGRVVDELAFRLAEDNPRFDIARFRAATHPNHEEGNNQ